MADPFVAEIRVFPFNFPPRGWAFCDGQLLPLSQNTALFSLLGTVYGGNGKSNFSLPDLRDRSVIGPGQGPGLSLYDHGQVVGSSTVSLLESEIPHHTHQAKATTDAAELSSPESGRSLARAAPGTPYRSGTGAPQVAMAPEALAPAGGDQPHQNRQPTVGLHFCLALQGVFPPRG
jgi:microcystin-dependent protein